MKNFYPGKGLDYLWLSRIDYENMQVEIEFDGKFVAAVSQEDGIDKLLFETRGKVKIESLSERILKIEILQRAFKELTAEFERDFPQNRSDGSGPQQAGTDDDMSLDALSYVWEDGSADEGAAVAIRRDGLLVAHVRRQSGGDDLIVAFPGPSAPEDQVVRKIRLKVFQHALETAASMFRDR